MAQIAVHVTFFFLVALASFALQADAYALGLFCEEGQDHCECTEFACWCVAGYESAGDRKTCRDHNECACGQHTCEEEDLCLNTEGSFVCITPEHVVELLEEHPTVDEDDVGECRRGEAHCFCKNHYCECEDGYEREENRISCIDVDECTCTPFPCAMYELCINTHGSYACMKTQDILEIIKEEEEGEDDKTEDGEDSSEHSESTDVSTEEDNSEETQPSEETSTSAGDSSESMQTGEESSSEESESSDSSETNETETDISESTQTGEDDSNEQSTDVELSTEVTVEIINQPSNSPDNKENEESEQNEESSEDNTKVEYRFLERQYTCEESGEAVLVCQVCIGAYGPVSVDTIVNVTTIEASAESDKDFSSIIAQVIFKPAGTSVLCVDVEILPDHDDEGNEVFIIELEYVDDCDQERYDSTSVLIADSCSEILDVSFSQAVYNVDEGAGSVSVCINLSGEKLHKHVSLSTNILGTSNHHALDIADFHPFSMQIDCGDVEDNYCIDIAIEDDSFSEDEETFVVYLSDLSSCVDSQLSLAMVVIHDNDESEPEEIVSEEDEIEFRFMSRQYTCEEFDDELPCEVCVGAYGSLNSAMTVNVSTVHGSANPGGDYENLFASLMFAPGDTVQCVDIDIISDSEYEGNRVFVVQLDYQDSCDESHSDSASVILYDGCIEVTEIKIAEDSYIVGEGDGSVRVCVNVIEGKRHSKFTLATTTVFGSNSEFAQAGVDFVSKSDTIDCGEVGDVYCADIEIVDDQLQEQEEAFMVYITDMSMCMESSQQSVVVFITDNDS